MRLLIKKGAMTPLSHFLTSCLPPLVALPQVSNFPLKKYDSRKFRKLLILRRMELAEARLLRGDQPGQAK
jgi:hypothetical protein